MKLLVLECGGRASSIVFNNRPMLEAVADAVVARAFWNQGQLCTTSSRLLVHEGIRDELLHLVTQKSSQLVPSDSLLSDSRFGTDVSWKHEKKIWDYVDIGEKQGAQDILHSPSARDVEGGFYVSPVVFDRVISDQRIAREGIFGPALSVLSFRDEAEAIWMANSMVCGLSAILWIPDRGRALRVTQEMKVGSITVNATGTPGGGPSGGALATGGHKESGLGVQGGIEGLEAYTSRTTVQYLV